MARTPSKMVSLGFRMPHFSLPNLEGTLVSPAEAKHGYLVAFICNHCPFVKHIQKPFSQVLNHAMEAGLGVYAINANDVEQYPDDSPEKMRIFAKENNFRFPYLFDESQEIAKAFDAACTPDFYLFDQNKKLIYRGQFDDSRPGNEIPPDGRDLQKAILALLQGKMIPEAQQKASLGCNIKWKS